MTLGILKRFYFGMSKSRRFNLSWLQGCPLSGIETLVTRSDNINLLSIPFSSNNRGCPMILCVRIKKTMELVDALLQRIDNIINPRRVCRLAALRRRPCRVCRLAALRRRPRRIRAVIGVRCGVQRPRRDVVSVRCGADQQPAAGQPRQEQPAHIRRQRQSSVPRQPVLGNVPDIVGDECDINRALDPMPRRVGAAQGAFCAYAYRFSACGVVGALPPCAHAGHTPASCGAAVGAPDAQPRLRPAAAASRPPLLPQSSRRYAVIHACARASPYT